MQNDILTIGILDYIKSLNYDKQCVFISGLILGGCLTPDQVLDILDLFRRVNETYKR